MDNPSWLDNPSSNAGPTPPPAEVFSLDTTKSDSASTAKAANTKDAPVILTPEEEKDLPGIILVMRLANMGVAIALMACSVSDTPLFPEGYPVTSISPFCTANRAFVRGSYFY